ncbi:MULTISPECIES: hypothetical protein [Gordonia]|uniref:Uncharacterized protein n=1 Tax=Gordonia jacobaea TaxID=122202 RepID=A0ABR5IHK8_9ACTN|nr:MULTISPECIES: hypothetical protein [Gordonia]KNA93214.1 hypothetical protein ABW18_02005 [Gordonia jacobaea]
MSDVQTTEKAESSTPPVKAPAEVVASIKKFVAGEGGAAKAVLQPIGTAGVRITLVGESDGYLGDRVVDDIATAHAVVDAVPGLEIGEWDRELTSKATVSPEHYRKMAGWVAHSEHFPKARNSAII